MLKERNTFILKKNKLFSGKITLPSFVKLLLSFFISYFNPNM